MRTQAEGLTWVAPAEAKALNSRSAFAG
jgi:hypothetical protein